MLINSARRMPSIGRRISIEVGDLARRLSANILGCPAVTCGGTVQSFIKITLMGWL